MPQKAVFATSAPKPLGPYTPGVFAGSFLFVSGQTPIDPATGELVVGDIGVQTERALKNVATVLDAAGLTMRHIVKTTVFLTSMSDFTAMNEVYARFFSGVLPARSTIAVKELPRAASVEIEAVAYLE